jgi:hypothetical protein
MTRRPSVPVKPGAGERLGHEASAERRESRAGRLRSCLLCTTNRKGSSQMATYGFKVASFHIGETRSGKLSVIDASDTLFASTSLKVTNALGLLHHDFGAQGAALNDHKSGSGVDLNIPWTNVDVPDPTPENPDGGTVTWTFLLVNHGDNTAGFVDTVNSAANGIAGAVSSKIIGAQGVNLAALAGFVGIKALQELFDLLTADCDGTVAVGAFSLTAADLRAMTGDSGLFRTTQNNPGTDSPHGCGPNSSYDVTYEIAREIVRVAPDRREVAAVSTGPGETSLYVMGLPNASDSAGQSGSQVWTKFFPDPNRPGQWSDWFPLGPNVFPAGQPVTALRAEPGKTSLYVMGLPNASDGAGHSGSQVWSRFFPDPNHPGQWSDWLALGPNVFPTPTPTPSS